MESQQPDQPPNPFTLFGVQNAILKSQLRIFTKYEFESKGKACLELCQPLKDRYLAVAFRNDTELNDGAFLDATKTDEEDELLELSLMCQQKCKEPVSLIQTFYTDNTNKLMTSMQRCLSKCDLNFVKDKSTTEKESIESVEISVIH